MANVRFYRLHALPVWDTKYKGIFVHIDGEFNPYTYEDGKYAQSFTVEGVNYKAWKYGKETTGERRLDLDLYFTTYDKLTGEEQTLGEVTGRFTYRGLSQVLTGLWFGGTNGWELLTNDTDVNYINQLIDSKINTLDVDTLIDSKINALDVDDTVDTVISENVSSGTGTKLTFKGVKEVDGKIQKGEGTSNITIGDGALKISGYGETTSGETPSIPTVTATDVFSANDTADSIIALSNAFVFNSTNNNKTIDIRTKTAVSATNNIVTETDIASLSGAMHYKGGITTYPTPTADTKAGDTYVVTTGFTNSGTTYEVGDMFVANANGASATYTVVQTNMTVGVADGQIATNNGALAANKIVIATANGIQTTTYTVGSESNASSRTQSIADDTADSASIIHGTTETDSIEILGKTNSKTLKIASSNASVEVKKNGKSEIDIDLVWNTFLP